MNGAESLVRTLIACGIDTCFANPGTSEMHFVAALDQIPGIRCIPGMQENVVTGMADGYWRIAERPAATLLHCGPGLANGLANLHNARRGRSGVVNIVGDQATYHRVFDAALTADTEGFARGVSQWVRTATSAERVGTDAAVAVQAASTAPGNVATLILPADTAWNAGGVVAAKLPVPQPSTADANAVRAAARALKSGRKPLLLLGGKALHATGQALAARIIAATGCDVLAEWANGRIARGQGRLAIEKVPYPAPQAIERLKDYTDIVVVNAVPPVGFFAYPNVPSRHYPETANIWMLSRIERDAEAGLRALVEELGAPEAPIAGRAVPEAGKGVPTSEGFAQTLAAAMPEGAIVADEAVSFGRAFFTHSHGAPPHDWIQNTGGAIGGGMPMATGAAVAGGGRRVVNPQADGSGMYTLQSLWTQARERLPVTTIIFANRKYQILLGEYFNVGANPGRTAMDMLDLGNPDLDWVRLAGGMGVEGARTETLEGCADLIRQANGRKDPFLIELMIP